MNARRDEFPETRMTETTAVKIPKGATEKRKLSRILVDSDKNCLLSRSPKRDIRGA